MPNTTLSAFCEETTRCDARAFAALCRHLKEYDTDHTVILIQVENETGLLGAARDHSDAADEKFAEKVPEELIRALKAHEGSLAPDLREALSRRSGETWGEVFGSAADEVFMAWYTAKHVEAVAAAGKAEDTSLLGTYGYAAPEQFGFGSSNAQTDLYSVGVLLCEMITGHLPKEGLPEGKVGEIIRKCTRIDPEDRYASVDDLLEVLHKFLASTAPTDAKPAQETAREINQEIPLRPSGEAVLRMCAASVRAWSPTV